MSRIVTSSEVDRLHQQVAELQGQVTSLHQTVYSQQLQNNELSLRVFALEQSPNLTPAKSDDEFEAYDYKLEVVDSQETRADADPVVDVLASELPSAS